MKTKKIIYLYFFYSFFCLDQERKMKIEVNESKYLLLPTILDCKYQRAFSKLKSGYVLYPKYSKWNLTFFI